MPTPLIFRKLEEALDRINLEDLDRSSLSTEQVLAHRDLVSIGREILTLHSMTTLIVRKVE